jgi:hypothetical protein
VTAKSAKSLGANIRSLTLLLEANPSTYLLALSYIITARRLHYGYRVACLGDSIPSILKELKLRAKIEGFKPILSLSKLLEVAFIFTG